MFNRLITSFVASSIVLFASITINTISTSDITDQAVVTNPDVPLNFCTIPGVSWISIYTPLAISEDIPIISLWVVLDLFETADIGALTNEFKSEDFPAFGGPTIAIEINLGSIG